MGEREAEPKVSASDTSFSFSRRLRQWRPFPHEVVAALYIIVGVWLLERLPVTYPRAAILYGSLLPIGFISVTGGLVLLFRQVRDRRRGGGRMPIAGEWILLLRVLIPLGPTLAVHFLLKSFIFLINSRTWDRQLYDLDQRLFFGFSPSRFFTALFDNVPFLHVIDIFYSNLYFFVVVITAGLLLTVGPARRRMAFGSAYMLLWIVGTVIYIALPSWGPVFVFSDDFQNTLPHMPLTMHIQETLFREIHSLVVTPLAPRLIRLGSVAALPSLHIGVIVLFTLATFRLSRRWFSLNLFLTLVMLIGSVITGYHYLVDDYLGALVAVAVWIVSLRLFLRDDTSSPIEERERERDRGPVSGIAHSD